MKKSYIILIFACLFPLHMHAMTILLGRGQALLAQAGSSIGLISAERAKPENFIQSDDPRAEQWGVTPSAGAGACDTNSLGVSGSLQAAGQVQLREVDKLVNHRLQALQQRISPDKQNQAKKTRFDELHGIVTQAQSNVGMYNFLVEEHNTTQHVASPEVKKLLESRLQNPANFIPSNQTLQDLEDHATSITNEADLSFTSHVQASQEYCAKKLPHTGFFMQQLMGYPLGAASYCKDIAVPQVDADYFAGVIGAAATLGGAYLVSKNSSNTMQIACLGLGFASGVALKRMISQSFFKDLNALKLQGIAAAVRSEHDRLHAVKEALAARMEHSEVTTRIESVEHSSNRRHGQVTAGLEQARNAAQDARIIAEQTNIAVAQVSAQVNDLGLLARQHEQSLARVADQQGRLEAAVRNLNDSLRGLGSSVTVSQKQLRAWFNQEATARDNFEANLMQELGNVKWMQVQTFLNTQRQLYLAEQTAVHQGVIVNSHAPGSYGDIRNFQQLMPAVQSAPRSIVYRGPAYQPIKSIKLFASERNQESHKQIMNHWASHVASHVSSPTQPKAPDQVCDAAAKVIQQKFRLHKKIKSVSSSTLEELS
jgi:hypothetical protein